ncbi:hypothetical protein QG145_11040 [Kingella kingae]|nr:hypothetical protein [Kingella kingae]
MGVGEHDKLSAGCFLFKQQNQQQNQRNHAQPKILAALAGD